MGDRAATPRTLRRRFAEASSEVLLKTMLEPIQGPETNRAREKYQSFSMHEIDRYGIGQVMDSALLHLLSKNPDRPIHVSYDIGAVDPLHAPATGTAVRGDLTYRDAHYVAEAVVWSGALQSAEIVELNPKLSSADGSKDTIELAVGLITSLMGKIIL